MKYLFFCALWLVVAAPKGFANLYPGDVGYGLISVTQSDRKIVTLGKGRAYPNDTPSFALSRFLTNGALDDSFGNHGSSVLNVDWNDSPKSVHVLRDGKILVVGTTQHRLPAANPKFLDMNQFLLTYRLLPNGQLDLDYGSQGFSKTLIPTEWRLVRTVLDTAEGLLAFGTYEGYGRGDSFPDDDAYRNTWGIRLKANGSKDAGYGDSGEISMLGYDDGLILKSSDGSFLYATNYVKNSGNDAAFLRIRKYFETGKLDLSFGNKGIVDIDISKFYSGYSGGIYHRSDRQQIFHLNRQLDGSILVLGAPGRNYYNQFDLYSLKLKSDGSLDQTYGRSGLRLVKRSTNLDNGEFVTVDAEAIEDLPNGRILVIGTVHSDTRERLLSFLIGPDGSAGPIRVTEFGMEKRHYANHFRIENALRVGDETVLVTGAYLKDRTGLGAFGLLEIRSDGQMESSFGNGSIVLNNPLQDFLPPAGRSVVDTGVHPNP